MGILLEDIPVAAGERVASWGLPRLPEGSLQSRQASELCPWGSQGRSVSTLILIHKLTLPFSLNPKEHRLESKTDLGSSTHSTADSLHDLGQVTSVSLSLSFLSPTSWG